MGSSIRRPLITGLMVEYGVGVRSAVCWSSNALEDEISFRSTAARQMGYQLG